MKELEASSFEPSTLQIGLNDIIDQVFGRERQAHNTRKSALPMKIRQ